MDDALRTVRRYADDLQERAIPRWPDDQKPRLVVILARTVPDGVVDRMHDVRIMDAMFAGTREDSHIVKLVLTIYNFFVKRRSVDRPSRTRIVENQTLHQERSPAAPAAGLRARHELWCTPRDLNPEPTD